MAASTKEAASSIPNENPEALNTQETSDTFVTYDSMDNNMQEKSATLFETRDRNEESLTLDKSRSSLNEEELDLCSPKFNPSLALKSDVTVPSPNILTYKSLSSYEEAVKRRRQKQESKLGARKSKDEAGMSTPKSKGGCETKTFSHYKPIIPGNDTPRANAKGNKKQLKERSLDSKLNFERKASNREPEMHQTSKSSLLERKAFTERHEDQSNKNQSEEDKASLPTSSRQHGKKEKKNIFTRMETVSGPLSLLNRCVKNKEHVRVVTRGAVTLNSICRGYIVAFDKYFNMAMIDVDEIYRRPAELGKVKARISQKLQDAQETLKREKDEYRARLNSKFAPQVEGQSIVAGPALGSLPKKQDKSKQILDRAPKDPNREQILSLEMDRSKDHEQPSSKFPEKLVQVSGSKSVEADNPRTTKLNLRLLQSIYSYRSAPFSPYEREALMLGIPDENVEHRHLNQLLLRGENVVSVSIIEEF
ncbi:U7 snRNA-associated sm-like protein lsm11 [Plakobranchus ocellatus]|uniref:U7 snRNA-associated sm-like protein lsm11 n=1 Tax=Plakobranchus ocellatus TaxID=259542 RepID=A0AAV3YFM5_9GAST|nr:U7 snRNA-associated sm-like protein lsm11 [Plakobranchus ocellatus]